MRWRMRWRGVRPTRAVLGAALGDLLVRLAAGAFGYGLARLVLAAIAGPSPATATAAFTARCCVAGCIVTDWALRWRRGDPRR